MIQVARRTGHDGMPAAAYFADTGRTAAAACFARERASSVFSPVASATPMRRLTKLSGLPKSRRSAFGTANAAADLSSTAPGSQGQWFTDLENFVQSSYNRTAANDPGVALTSIQWTYWAINANDSGNAILGSDWASLANPDKIFTHLCSIERAPIGVTCTGTLPAPY